MKWIFKWLLRLFISTVILAVVSVVIFLLSYNFILRVAAERLISVQTGMETKIGSLKVALTSPTVEILDFKIRNTPDFGGTPFFNIPEIRVEYDLAALKRREIHIKLLRFNLGELDIVKNQAGRTNIFLGGIKLPAKNSGGGNSMANFKNQAGYDFTGIDEFNVSIGKVKFVDLQDQRNNREQVIGIDEFVIPNVKSQADLMVLAADIALHSNGFFDPLVGQKKTGLGVLKQLGL
jgi:uncharacterized protein involved in outer membrane biogenesis